MKKSYLRVIYPKNKGQTETLELFEGNIKKDKKYWKKYQERKVRYFELKEKK
jgi:hypothetical protein